MLNVDVFTADLAEQDALMCFPELDPVSRLRLQKITHPSRRAQFILGRALLGSALRYKFGARAASWRLELEPDGKPTLRGEGAPAISLSHSCGLVACAMAEAAVGLDVEYCRERDYTALLAQLGGYHTMQEDAALSSAERNARFYAYWTLREAMFKLRGELPGTASTEAICHRHFRPRPEYLAAVATNRPLRLTLHRLFACAEAVEPLFATEAVPAVHLTGSLGHGVAPCE